ncbi:hypothetical protein [Deefgea rivuli]|uniref:hypothetical protein n=1 Tax=Deefgea rivuli TaxID=400948 RepID=UPI0004814B2E|nr:hypothetical protein [Deefgea rivuli]
MSNIINVQRTDGWVGIYEQNDPSLIRDWMEYLEPRLLFKRGSFCIASQGVVNLIATQHIAWIDVHTDQPYQHVITRLPAYGYVDESLALDGRAVFLAELESCRMRWRLEYSGQARVGEPFEALIEVLFDGGFEYYLQVKGRLASATERVSLLNGLLDQGVFLVQRSSGGFTMINTRNVTRARIYQSHSADRLPPATLLAEPRDDDRDFGF